MNQGRWVNIDPGYRNEVLLYHNHETVVAEAVHDYIQEQEDKRGVTVREVLFLDPLYRSEPLVVEFIIKFNIRSQWDVSIPYNEGCLWPHMDNNMRTVKKFYGQIHIL